MKLLFITNMYPTKTNPVYGIFVKEQIDDICSTLHCEHDIYFINGREKGISQYLRSIIELPFKISSGKYDIIHIHYGLAALFLLLYKPKCQVFLTLHGADILNEQRKSVQVYLTRKVITKVDKVFILNTQMEDVVKHLNKNYETLPCGVNTGFFKPLSSRKVHSGKKLIIFPGNPSVEVKNFPLFQKTVQYLQEQSSFEIECRTINNLTREEVRDALNVADCLLMTSISEGSPQVIKEALSCGLPVVSVPVGDVNIMVEAVPDCYISQTRRPEELAKLVLLSFGADNDAIRKAFIEKNVYDNRSVTQRVIANYLSN